MSSSIAAAFKQVTNRKVGFRQYDDPETEQRQNELTDEANMLKEEVRSLFDSGHIIASDQMGEYEGRAQNIFNRAAEINVEIDGFKSAKDLIEQATAPKDPQTKMQENAEKQNPIATAMLLASQFRQNNSNELISGGENINDQHMPAETITIAASAEYKAQDRDLDKNDAVIIQFSGSEKGSMPDGMDAGLKRLRNVVRLQPSLPAMRA